MRNKPKAQLKQPRLKRVVTPHETQRVQLRRLVAHLQDRREEECLGIIQAVHDELLSRLVRISLDLGELRRQSRAQGRSSQLVWMGAAQRLKEAVQIAASVRAQLTPPLLDHCGLEAAIGWAASEWTRRHGLRCEVAGTIDLSRGTSSMALNLFRLFEEALRGLTESCEPAHLRVDIASKPTGHSLTLRTRALAVSVRRKLLCSPTFLSVRERARRLDGTVVVRDTSPFESSVAITVPAGS